MQKRNDFLGKIYFRGLDRPTFMDVFNLPQDIFPHIDTLSESIIIHDYTAKMGSFKGRSILHRNAISLVLHGRKTMHFSEKTVIVNESEFHFLSCGNCMVSMDLPKRDIFRSILIFFDDKTLAEFYLKYDSIISALKRDKKIRYEAYLSFKKDDFVNNYISSLALLTQSKKRISAEMKLLKFEELMLHLLEKYPDMILSFQPGSVKEFDDLEIRRIVEANVTSNLNVEELAFLCNVSLSTFKRRFTKIYHTTPNKWLLQRRMEMAANLLNSSKEKPSDVFYKVGYENHSSFTKSFKQIFGITPKEYQAQKLNV